MNERKILYCIFCTILFIKLASGGVMHTHSNHLNKERTKDGAFSPRDKEHFSDDEHHSEFDHEAIIGSHKEAEEFDHLEPEEAKRRLGILLKKMDLNGDNQIDRKELKAWILRSFKMLSEEEANERLEDADEDGDGFVTWKEYIADAYGVDDPGENENALFVGEEEEHWLARDKAMWPVADIDGDGRLHSEEWLVFYHPEEHPVMFDVILKQTLKEKDKNEDSAIDFDEFVAANKPEKNEREWLQFEKKRFDQSLDVNKDGVLTENEILRWMVPDNEELAEEEVEHLFACDDNEDDLLSFDEVLDHHEIFVGSEATYYGEHLENIHKFQDEL